MTIQAVTLGVLDHDSWTMTLENFRINDNQFGLIANVNMSASTRFHNKIFNCWPCNDLIVEANFGFEVSVLICETSKLVALNIV